MINSHISIKAVIANIYRDLGLSTELPTDDVIEWIGSALEFIGAYGQYEPKIAEFDIDEYKVKIPLDLYKLVYVTYNGYPLTFAGKHLGNNIFCPNCTIPTQDINTTNGTLSTSGCGGATFYLNDTYIITSIQTGKICLEYIAIPVDEDGYPLVPDNVSYMKALTCYVTKMLDYREWRKGNIPDKVFQHSEKEWNWYCAQAKGAANMPDLGQLERLKNVMVRLIPKQNEFNTLFRTNGSQERRKLW